MFETDRWSMAITFLLHKKMEVLLAHDSKLTPQELFVMICIAYMYMLKGVEEKDNIKDKITYWEPYLLTRDRMEDYVQ